MQSRSTGIAAKLTSVWMGRDSEPIGVRSFASAAGSGATQTAQPQIAPESSFGPNGVWYFAYGSNMNPNTLKGRRQVNPLESRPGALRGWKLSFRMLGLPYVEPGFATIEREGSDGGDDGPSQRLSSSSVCSFGSGAGGRWESEVHGVLHHVSTADWIQIMATEGVGAGKSGYRVVEVEVTLYDGRRVRALTLEGQSPSLHSLSRPVSPSARYLNLLRDGARHYGVDADYITYLDSLKPYDGNGWNAAVGRAISLGVAMPLALPLLPPVFLLRMARRSSNSNKVQEGAGRQAAGGFSGPTAAECATTADCAEAASKGAVAPSMDVHGAAVAATQPATVTAVMSVAPSTPGYADGGIGIGGGGQLPPQLLRPPLVLPAVVSGYVWAVQYATWAVHDLLAATLLGSGASNSGNGDGNGKS